MNPASVSVEPAPHPGAVLVRDFLDPLGLTQVSLARHLGVPIQRINELARGKRGITPETAWLLAGALATTPGYWMSLQQAHDLERARPPRVVPQLLSPLQQRRVAWDRFARWERTHPLELAIEEAHRWLVSMWRHIAEHDPQSPRDPMTAARNVEAMHARLAALR